MGYNSTVVVMNDALDSIAKDADFGKKIADAIRHLSVNNGWHIDIHTGSHVNGATVIETHHADMTTLVAVGGNYANVLGSALGYRHHTEEDKVSVLKQVADQLGYRLVKKRAT